ncbi:class D sortase [Bacillus sp. m3-13]|uniref:class D sortase n=1 Tax=Bacillus sp. m3-13 TaxID=406124 RepID=UPI0001E89EB1|nr:class D sortase [Bacillus sp. m3-13]
MRDRCLVVVLWILMGTGAVLFVGSGLLYWQGVSAVEEKSKIGSKVEEGGGQEWAVPLAVNIAAGDEIGEVYIPVLEVGISVFHGVTEGVLGKGVGHVPGTSLPGDGGNIVLSGHRDTVFRRLEEIKVGDKVVFEFGGGLYTYKIGKIRVVDKEDTSVVVPRPSEVLTITTCYPFRFIGSAPERYVLEAEFIGKELLMEDGLMRETQS